MKELKTAQQFSNDDFIAAQADLSSAQFKAAVQLPDNGFVAVNESPNPIEPADTNTQVAGLSGWLLTGLALVVFLGGLQWAEFVTQSLSQSWLQGGAAVALTGFGFASLGKLLWTGWRSKRQQQMRQQWREDVQSLQQSLQYGQAAPLCQRILAALPQADRSAFLAQHNLQLSDAETLQLFDLLVLQPLDLQAAMRISAAAKQTGMAVAVSPFALADMALVSWRAWRLMAELSTLYGVQLGVVARLGLFKKFANLLFWTGATELAIDIGGDFLGVELSSKLSARAGQGVLAGLMLARLGRFVQQELRPFPLVSAEKPVQPLLQSLIQQLIQRSPAQ
jgi:putative membrane protein